jgi:hypothetical protein
MMPVPPRGGPGTICLKQPEQQVHPVGDKSSVWQGWWTAPWPLPWPCWQLSSYK